VELFVRTVGPISNGTCEAATTLDDEALLLGQSVATSPTTIDLSPGELADEEQVVFYQAELPPGTSLAVSLRAYRSGLDAAPVSGCGATEVAGVVQQDGYTVHNTTNEPRTERFAVAASTGGDAIVGFDVKAAIKPHPYTVATLDAACDDLSMAPALDIGALGSSGELPFPFLLAGDAVTQYSILPFGAVALANGFPYQAPFGETWVDALPDPTYPPGLVAPFLTALSESAGGMDVRAATLGSAPGRRWVVQWSGVGSLYATTPVELTFQAKLLEQSNLIEFHYCSLKGDPGEPVLSGGGALIGVSSVDNLRGVEVTRRKAGAIASGKALRFSPE
jgi:hypothetical protein